MICIDFQIVALHVMDITCFLMLDLLGTFHIYRLIMDRTHRNPSQSDPSSAASEADHPLQGSDYGCQTLSDHFVKSPKTLQDFITE